MAIDKLDTRKHALECLDRWWTLATTFLHDERPRSLPNRLYDQPVDFDFLNRELVAACDRLGFDGLPFYNAGLVILRFDPTFYGNPPEHFEAPSERELLDAMLAAQIARDRLIALRPIRAKAKAVVLANEDRDKWIYEQCHKGVAYKSIIAALAKKTKWESIESTQGLKMAASRYADRHNLPPIPKRQHGRNRK